MLGYVPRHVPQYVLKQVLRHMPDKHARMLFRWSSRSVLPIGAHCSDDLATAHYRLAHAIPMIFGPQLNLTTFSIGMTIHWKHAMGGCTLWLYSCCSNDLSAAHYQKPKNYLALKNNFLSGHMFFLIIFSSLKNIYINIYKYKLYFFSPSPCSSTCLASLARAYEARNCQAHAWARAQARTQARAQARAWAHSWAHAWARSPEQATQPLMLSQVEWKFVSIRYLNVWLWWDRKIHQNARTVVNWQIW